MGFVGVKTLLVYWYYHLFGAILYQKIFRRFAGFPPIRFETLNTHSINRGEWFVHVDAGRFLQHSFFWRGFINSNFPNRCELIKNTTGRALLLLYTLIVYIVLLVLFRQYYPSVILPFYFTHAINCWTT